MQVSQAIWRFIRRSNFLPASPSSFSFNLNLNLNKKQRSSPAFSSAPSTALNANMVNVKLKALCSEGCVKEALNLMRLQPDILLECSTYACILQLCANTESLAEGMQVHAYIRGNEVEQNLFIATHLVRMYAKCGSLENARLVFDKMHTRNVFIWNSMIRGYAWIGPFEEALALFYSMLQQDVGIGIEPDNITFSLALKACAALSALPQGKEIHCHIVRRGHAIDAVVGTALLDMYAKCESIDNARHLFDKMPERNIVSWSAIMGGYVHNRLPGETLSLFHQMQLAGPQPNSISMVTVLSASADLAALQQGKRIHAYIITSGFESDLSVGNALIDMYFKCESLEIAHKVFRKMPKRNVVSWTVVISGYAKHGLSDEALTLFHQMQLAGVKPNSITMLSICPTLTHSPSWLHCQRIHSYIVKSGFESYRSVSNTLIDVYAKCGSLHIARQVFDQMSKRDVVSWNAMLSNYAYNGDLEEAMYLFKSMHLVNVKANSVTVRSVLPICALLGALQYGKLLHAYIIRSGFQLDVSVGNSLIDMYAKCGSMDVARKIFQKMSKRDIVSWNSMIAGYAHSVHANEALTLFLQMQLIEVKPDSVTILSVVQACANLAVLQQAMEIHAFTITNGFELDVTVNNALVNMYAKCGSIEIAHQLFVKLSKRDVISWNSMIASYTQNGRAREALTVFHQMRLGDTKPDSVTMVSVLPACANLAALQQGKWIHAFIFRSGHESHVSVQNALIDMYSKCGSIEAACNVFDKMSQRDVVSWNAMIAGYGMHGQGKEALARFSEMQKAGLKPTHITFIAVLSACSHAGLVNEGLHYFNCMSHDHCITPMQEHYACTVDLLGRAGHLDEAYNFVKKMPLEPSASVWGALLLACRICCNAELGEYVLEHLLRLEPENTGAFILLSDIYVSTGRWDDVAKVRTKLNDKVLRKSPGCSWIEIKDEVHVFLAGYKLHPQFKQIYAMLEKLSGQLKEAGYIPNKNFVPYDVEEEEKESSLCCHSEKLAIAFGLLNTCRGVPIRITKNLRACSDCHSATKFISKIVGREIIVRDANRFHNFRNGLCSCGDYW
jgi:pentatricopeptide repeat protein